MKTPAGSVVDDGRYVNAGRNGAGPEVDYHRAFNHLCHVLSLSRTGKPRAALDSMVITACALGGDNVDGTSGVDEALQTFFGLPVPAQDLASSIDRLRASGKLLPTGAGVTLQIAPAARAEVQERTTAGDELEQEVRQEWLDSLAAAGIRVGGDADVLWRCLRRYMARVFQQHGVLSVELLAPDATVTAPDVASLDAALDAALTEEACTDRDIGRVAIKAFFESSTPARTKYLAQLLDNTFTFYAVSIHEAAARYMRALPALTLFFDTNFIFGLLGLHTNSLGDVGKELISFIRENKFPFKLYFHEETLAEIQRTIAGIGRRLVDQRWPQQISRAAVSNKRLLGALTGVEYRYHALNAVHPVDPKDFLSKYNHVEQLLDEYGIKLYREPFNTPAVSTEDRGELIAEYEAFVDVRRPNDPKPYEALDHDIRVWLAVQGKRTAGGATPIDGGALFVTLDLLFHAFDRQYLRTYNQAPGSVALPNQLLQVLRPFGRQSADFDARFVETFGISEIRTAHSDYGVTTSKVLSLLASFSEVSEETAVRILADEVLLQDLSGVEEESEAFRQRIDNALVADNAHLLEEQESVRRQREAENEAHVRELAEKEAAIAALRSEMTTALAKVDEDRQAAERRADERHAEMKQSIRRSAADVNEQVAARKAESQRARRAERHARLAAAALVAVIAAVLIGIVPWATHWAWLEGHDHREGLYLSATALTAVACWAIVAPDSRRRSKAVATLGVVGGIVLQIV